MKNKSGVSAGKKKKKREKFNFVPWLIALGVIAVIVGGVAAVYYGGKYIDENVRIVKLEYKSGKYYDKKNNVTYSAAPMYYTYAVKSEERYAKSGKYDLYYVGHKDGDAYVLESPASWLTTDIDHGAVIYYNAEKVSLPEPSEFKWNIMYLCNPDGLLYATNELDAPQTSRLLSAYYGASDSENLYGSLYGTGQIKLLKELRVTSSAYPFLHLVLYLFTDNEGGYYIGSAYEERLIKADNAVFDPFFGGGAS